MDLIDLYVREVGRNLPEKMRPDIEREIRSSIEDILEDESVAQGRAPDEAMMVEVLKRLGSPAKMAASYLPPRYLIGPQLFPHYMTALRAVVAVTTVLATLSFGLSIGATLQPEGSLVDAFIKAFTHTIYVIMQAIASVTFIFAMVQLSEPNLKLPEKAWDPRSLKAEPDPERVKMGEKVGEVTGLVLGLVIFNLYREWIGFNLQEGGQWVHMPVLSNAFMTYLLWINLVMIAEIGRDTWLMVRGRWSCLLRWITVGLDLGKVALGARMLTGPALIAIDPVVFNRLGWALTPDMAAQVVNSVNLSVRLVIGVGLAFGIYDLGGQLYKLMLRGKLPVQLVGRV